VSRPSRRSPTRHATCALVALLGASTASSLAACSAGDAPDPSTPSDPASATLEAAGVADPAAVGVGGTAAAQPVQTALRFVDGTAASGVSYRHQPSRSANKYMPEIMGGGVAVLDVDRDGDPDLLFSGGGNLAGDPPPDSGPRLFVNDGTGRFTDASAAWGLPAVAAGYPMGVAVGDVDGDGWIDAYFTGWGAAGRLLRNTGAAFEDVTDASGAGTGEAEWTTSAAFLDVENDGDLDLYLARYVDFASASAIKCWHGDVPIYCTPQLYTPQHDRLLRNEGDGTFTDASEAAGISSAAGKGLAVATGDLDDDGDTDVFVANDLSPNLLWINDGAGAFAEQAYLAGVAVSSAGRAMAGMGADMGDVDGDGRVDIVDVNFQRETTNVFLQGEGLLFEEVSERLGVGAPSRERLKWGVDLFDADNDGDEDLLIAAGHLYDNVHLVEEPDMTMEQPNLLFEHRGEQLVDVSADAGPALADIQVSRGLVTSDLDGDGDLDFVVAQNGGTAQVAINETKPMGGWIGLWLEGTTANRSAIGARVTSRVGDRTLVREVRGASSYLSVPDLRVHVGLGEAARADDVSIRWPGGDVQELGAVEGGRWYRVVQGEAPVAFVPGQAAMAP